MSYLDLIQNDATAESDNTPVVFASTDMLTVVRTGCPTSQDSVFENGKCYRRLTPEYWAWFYYKYTLMEKALTNGKISEATFVEILDRISKLYNHAVTLSGKEALDDARRNTDVKLLDEAMRNEMAANNGSLRRAPSLVVERGR